MSCARLCLVELMFMSEDRNTVRRRVIHRVSSVTTDDPDDQDRFIVRKLPISHGIPLVFSVPASSVLSCTVRYYVYDDSMPENYLDYEDRWGLEESIDSSIPN